MALCRVAVEIMRDLTSHTWCENEKKSEHPPIHEEKEENDLEKIKGIDLSQSCLDDCYHYCKPCTKPRQHD